MTVPISHQIPRPICPLYICPAPGITRLRTAATPGFQAFGIRLCRKAGSKNSPQCLHFFAAKATSSEQYGQRTLGSIVAVGLAGVDILHPSGSLARPHELWGSDVPQYCSRASGLWVWEPPVPFRGRSRFGQPKPFLEWLPPVCPTSLARL